MCASIKLLDRSAFGILILASLICSFVLMLDRVQPLRKNTALHPNRNGGFGSTFSQFYLTTNAQGG
ncbi:MAG: hypothetical protein HC780_13105 [Leptolyngbyaceae cyanobacterium CSU_1_3]|nr:hypothetical protein [Leptolyngbyaceae cyanobacterium CSU_1_3]